MDGCLDRAPVGAGMVAGSELGRECCQRSVKDRPSECFSETGQRSALPEGRIELLRSDRSVLNREVPDGPCPAALIGVLAPSRDLPRIEVGSGCR